MLCVCFGSFCTAELTKRTVYRLPYVKYLTGANKATRTAYRALGKPDWTAARRAFLFAQTNDEWQAEPIRFFGASALFRISSASFLPILFWQDRKEWAAGGTPRHSAQKRYGPRSGGCGFANRTAPPEASGATKRNSAHPCRQKRKEKKK